MQHCCCFLHCLPLSVSLRHSTHMLLRCYPPTSLVRADEGISVISIITAEFQSPLSSLPLLEASLIYERFNVQDRACTRITSTVEHTHTHCVRRQEWRNTDCVVVTMALVSDFSHPESIILLKALLVDSVHGKSLLVELFQRHLATCIIRSPLPHHHDRSLFLLSLHSSQSSPSPPWLARCLSFRLVLSDTCQRLSLPFSPALLHLSQPHPQRL